MSMKRPATSAAGPRYRLKKAKVATRSTQKLTQQQLQRMVDVIDGVGSQAAAVDTDTDVQSVKSGKSVKSNAMDASDSVKSIGDSLTQGAITACGNLHAEVANLTHVIQQQRLQIGGLEKQLTTVLSLLQDISGRQCGQLSQFHQQLESQTSTIKSLTAAAAASGSTESRSSGDAADRDRRPDHPDRRTGLPSDRRTRSDRVVWGQRVDPTAGFEDNTAGVNESENDLNYDSDFTLIVHRTLNDVSRRKKNIVITGLPEESETDVSDRTTFEEFAAAFLPFKPALAVGRNCVRLGKPSFFRPRRLLVRLESEEAAAALLKDAPGLRRVNDKYIAQNVFINADLSPSAAKLAFETRKKRREAQKRRAAAGDRASGSGLASDAPSNSNSSRLQRGDFESANATDSSLASGKASSADAAAVVAAADAVIESGNSMDIGASSDVAIDLTAVAAVASSVDVVAGGSDLLAPSSFP